MRSGWVRRRRGLVTGKGRREPMRHFRAAIAPCMENNRHLFRCQIFCQLECLPIMQAEIENGGIGLAFLDRQRSRSEVAMRTFDDIACLHDRVAQIERDDPLIFGNEYPG